MIYSSLNIIYLILAAYIVSIAIEAVVILFERYHFSRSMAITVSYLLLIVFLLSGFILILPFVISQFTDIINILVAKINAIQTLLQTEKLNQIVASIPLIPNALRQEILRLLSDPVTSLQFQQKIQGTINQVTSTWKDYAQSLGTLAVSILTSFFSSLVQ